MVQLRLVCPTSGLRPQSPTLGTFAPSHDATVSAVSNELRIGPVSYPSAAARPIPLQRGCYP